MSGGAQDKDLVELAEELSQARVDLERLEINYEAVRDELEEIKASSISAEPHMLARDVMQRLRSALPGWPDTRWRELAGLILGKQEG